jgi:quinolinate synthase
LKTQNPGTEFFPATDKAICPNMKRITLEKILWSLQDLQYKVTVPKDVRLKAKKAIDRMVEVLPEK